MPTIRLLACALAIAVLQLPTIRSVSAEDPAEESTDSVKDRFSVLAGKIVIAPAGRPKELFHFHSQPLLSWSNPTRKTPAGALYLWTSAGRPQVALCTYPNGDHVIDLEFQSLSNDALSADSDNEPLWQPASPGVEWTTIENQTSLGKTPFARLRQMRQLARKFSGKLVPPNKNPIELRLLDTPIYRYELSANDKTIESSTVQASLGDPGESIIDGAIFTFVQGTDPEVLILVEAFESGEQQRWRYAIARMSMVPTQVRFDESLVWETDWAIRRPTTPYYVYKSF